MRAVASKSFFEHVKAFRLRLPRLRGAVTLSWNPKIGG